MKPVQVGTYTRRKPRVPFWKHPLKWTEFRGKALKKGAKESWCFVRGGHDYCLDFIEDLTETPDGLSSHVCWRTCKQCEKSRYFGRWNVL